MTNKALQVANDFVAFLNSSPSPYHAVDSVKQRLRRAGFEELSERGNWAGKVVRGGSYYMTRNGSSLVAFSVGRLWKVSTSSPPGSSSAGGIAAVGAHTDSPVLRIKPISRRSTAGFLQVGVEPYGGGIWHSWFDADLALAGRVIVAESNGGFRSRLVRVDKPLLKIPTLAIHLDRTVNTKFEFDKETQLLPVAGLEGQAAPVEGTTPDSSAASCCSGVDTSTDFSPLQSVLERHNEELVGAIAEAAGVSVEQIEDFELVLYDYRKATLGGLNNEFVFSARLDNLTSCYAATEALIKTSTAESLGKESGVRLISLFDHEEVGSSSAQGADSNLLPNVIERLTILTGDTKTDSPQSEAPNKSSLLESSAKSFFLSCDVAHGIHPNYTSKYESNHKPQLGKGPVIKINANQKYMTNSFGIVLLKQIAKIAKVPLQLFVIANNSPCGSTIGPIIASKTGFKTMDLGNSILSMHSIRETGSSYDIEKSIELFIAYFENFTKIEPTIIIDGDL